jgi:hypothetical protein
MPQPEEQGGSKPGPDDAFRTDLLECLYKMLDCLVDISGSLGRIAMVADRWEQGHRVRPRDGR